jgi:predicted nuclease of predicted toxin-antitoxin system
MQRHRLATPSSAPGSACDSSSTHNCRRLWRDCSLTAITAEHVADVGLLSASDAAIWRYASDHDAVLITKDEDFPDQVLLGGSAPVVVWIRVGNTTRRALLTWFDSLVDRVIAMIDSGERLIELR